MTWVLRATLIWLLVLTAPAVWLCKTGVTKTVQLMPDAITFEGGCGFHAPIAAPSFLRTEADGLENATASQLRLFENGKELGPPHSMGVTIEAQGRGVFGHWTDHVCFSSSDATDPRTNGRKYTAQYPVYLPSKIAVVGFLGPVVLLALAGTLYSLWRVATRRRRAAVGMRGWPGEAAASQWSFATLREVSAANSLFYLAGWAAFYTVALILVAASLTADQMPGKTFQINFEYKVF